MELRTRGQDTSNPTGSESSGGRDGVGRTGIVARNAQGQVIASRSVLHSNVGSAFVAEALAYSWAVKTGLELGVTEAIIEGDSLTIIKKCNNMSQDTSEIRAHIQNIQYHSSRFLSIQFKHANCEANQLAHILTIESLRNGEEFYLEGAVPGFVRRTMEDEWIREPD
ncbi:hypothetical protein J1N35_001290 [Gossypium stocksii]|uniref:RNase H type-1 domain-containing protein n=1 Tax=Gossypium stocksii TaxID=47602 RepID=A0A9D3WHE9_9ROSI|nr:hypothetical protein J1N35_001290 [Gossypium stocksii]